MKKIALYLLVLFSLVQFGPGLKAFFHGSSATIALFNPDEEKSPDSDNSDKTDKKGTAKEFVACTSRQSGFTAAMIAYLHTQDAIGNAPLQDIITPPPNKA